MRRFTQVLALGIILAGLMPASRALAAGRLEWPTVQEQLTKDHVQPGSALERLILNNQDFSVLNAKEFNDRITIPLWLRVLYRKNHPHDTFSPKDPTGGYPLVLHEVWEWMVSHQDLQRGKVEGIHGEDKTATETGEMRISGAQTSPRSETDIRVNYLNPMKIIGASNNISSAGRQAMFFSSNGGASWGQTLLPLVTGDSFQSDPTVEWTSDGTAWSTTIGINSAGTILKMRSYKSTDGGATWTFDNTFSGSTTNNDKQMIWVDHSATSPFKDNIYAIWHPGLPAVVARRTGPTGSWQTPVQVSGSETTGTAIGDDVKTNSAGDVFAFFPDTGSLRLNVAKSTNGGVSFGAPVRIGSSFASFQFAIPADASRQVLVYMTGGAYRTSSVNNVFAAWNDLSGDSGCTSGGGPGTNAASTCKSRIWFSRSTDGGTTWSTPAKINNQSGLNDQFFPWLVVDETNGKVAIAYYDTVGDSTRKTTNVYYQSSTDNGTTWSTPFKVTTAATNETTTGSDSGNQYGDYTGLSGIAGTFFPVWTDRRSGASEEVWTANIADGTIATPDFTISASPATLSVQQGNAGTSTVTTTVSGGFNNAIALSASGQPSGVTVGFSPSSIAAPGAGTSTATFTVASTTTPGTYPITITGTGGTTTHPTTVTLTVTSTPVPDFTISASPTSLSVAQGSAGSSTVTTTVSGGFNSAISLTPTGQPTGVTVSFSPSSTIAAPGSGSATVTFTVASTTVTGVYPIAITGTGGGKTHPVTITLTVTSGSVTQLLLNPGFESGAVNWTATSGVIDNSTGEPARTGSWKAWLDGYGTTHTDSIYQQVTIPSTAVSATLNFYLHIDTAETTTTSVFDTLAVQIRNSSNTVLATLHTYSNLDHNTGYALQSYNLIAYKGQTIRVYFLGTEDVSLQTSFVIDDTALNVN